MIIRKKHIIIAAGIIALCTLIVYIVAERANTPAMAGRFKVVLDAGHGSPDGGTVASDGTEEKDINLAIALKLREIMEGIGYDIVMTRSGDTALYDDGAKTIREKKVSDMRERRNIIESSGADLFLSIHMNSFSDTSVNGLHIFYDKSHPEAEELAKHIQAKIGEVTGAKTHAVKTADESLFLMKNSPIPSILAECGFLSNPEECEKLKTEDYQSRIAWAIAKAVGEYKTTAK